MTPPWMPANSSMDACRLQGHGLGPQSGCRGARKPTLSSAKRPSWLSKGGLQRDLSHCNSHCAVAARPACAICGAFLIALNSQGGSPQSLLGSQQPTLR
mmetsp:Transcript_21158/g.58764  ORF Transcript_21158/g.58764 Transcript_21158/m.58764 type:complete len:99 (+) Transcript_21158:976-1272(+)